MRGRGTPSGERFADLSELFHGAVGEGFGGFHQSGDFGIQVACGAQSDVALVLVDSGNESRVGGHQVAPDDAYVHFFALDVDLADAVDAVAAGAVQREVHTIAFDFFAGVRQHTPYAFEYGKEKMEGVFTGHGCILAFFRGGGGDPAALAARRLRRGGACGVKGVV